MLLQENQTEQQIGFYVPRFSRRYAAWLAACFEIGRSVEGCYRPSIDEPEAAVAGPPQSRHLAGEKVVAMNHRNREVSSRTDHMTAAADENCSSDHRDTAVRVALPGVLAHHTLCSVPCGSTGLAVPAAGSDSTAVPEAAHCYTRVAAEEIPFRGTEFAGFDGLERAASLHSLVPAEV